MPCRLPVVAEIEHQLNTYVISWIFEKHFPKTSSMYLAAMVTLKKDLWKVQDSDRASMSCTLSLSSFGVFHWETTSWLLIPFRAKCDGATDHLLMEDAILLDWLLKLI